MCAFVLCMQCACVRGNEWERACARARRHPAPIRFAIAFRIYNIGRSFSCLGFVRRSVSIFFFLHFTSYSHCILFWYCFFVFCFLLRIKFYACIRCVLYTWIHLFSHKSYEPNPLDGYFFFEFAKQFLQKLTSFPRSLFLYPFVCLSLSLHLPFDSKKH